MGGRPVYKFTQRVKSSSAAQFYLNTYLLYCHLERQTKGVLTKQQQQKKSMDTAEIQKNTKNYNVASLKTHMHAGHRHSYAGPH